MTRASVRPTLAPARFGLAALAAALRAAARPLLAHVRETFAAGPAVDRPHTPQEQTMNRMSASRRTFARRPLPLLAALGLAVVAGSSFAAPPCAPAPAPAPTPAAEFTGRFVAGAPVYRLPAITVSANRSVAAAESSVRKNEPRRRG